MRAFKFALVFMTMTSLAAFGDHRAMTDAEIVELVCMSLYSDHDDAALAERLDRIKPIELFSKQTVTELKNWGLGPLATAALEKIQQQSEGLQEPSKAPISKQSVPSQEESSEMLGHIVNYARVYIHNLPNFICDQITKRYTNLDGFTLTGQPRYGSKLRHGDSITAELAFAPDFKQDHVTLTSRGGTAQPRKGQSVSTGEFGHDMAVILGAGVDPQARWDHWELLRGRHEAVFRFFVGLDKTQYSLFYCCFLKPGVGQIQQSYNAPIRGLIYADPQTGEISRLVIQAVNLPSQFHIQEDNTIIDYGDVRISGQAYTLPVAARIFVRADSQKNRNEIAFVKYRKFEPDSILTIVSSRITFIQ